LLEIHLCHTDKIKRVTRLKLVTQKIFSRKINNYFITFNINTYFTQNKREMQMLKTQVLVNDFKNTNIYLN